MSLRWRVVSLLLALFILLTGTGLLIVRVLDRVDQQNHLIVNRLQPASGEVRSLLGSLVGQETGERGYLITGGDSFLETYAEGKSSSAARLGDLAADFTGDTRVYRAVHDVRTAVRTWHRVGAGPEITARRNGNAALARRLVAQGQGKHAFDMVRRSVARLQRMIDDRLADARESAATSAGHLRDVITLSAGVRLLLLIVAGLLLYRWVIVPVGWLRASMRRVIGGDLAQPVLASGPPEVAAIGRDAESMRRRIVAELETARAAGEALTQRTPVVAALRAELSKRSTSTETEFGVCGVQQAAEGVLAGDWWTTVQRPDGSTALVLADVSGHGPEAGLVALRLKERLTTLLHTELDLLTVFVAAADDLPDTDERFASCQLVQVHPESGELAWINAGHPPALVASRDGGEVSTRQLGPTGPLVSSVTSGWTVAHTTLGPDDLVVTLTDGVLDARRGATEFGFDGVLEVLRGLRKWTPEEAAHECVEAVRRFADDLHRDDVTCVVLARSLAAVASGR